MAFAFIFPGQGSQTVGMGRALCAAEPAARRVFEQVDEALGEALSRVIFEGPEERLRLTENAQPALMATSLAALRALEARGGRRLAELCECVAGHSLGEYSALAAAGSLTIEDAARLLRLRGRAMQAAVPVGEGAMAAILGLELAVVEEVAAAASAVGVCDVANDNAPGQVVVSGARAAVERAVELAKGKGAKRSMLLAVSAPFHCRLLAPAADAVRGAFAAIALRPPAVPLISNVTAAPETDPALLAARLVEQVTARVRWREILLTMAESGVEQTVELGAGRVLSGLTRRTVPGAASHALGTPEEIDAWLATARAN
ncbi:MAG TPA: ACP S-malonyltransferase [Geminicoccaceae bacterium]|nr:ACP S-malonyltransferase [Geminicoccaceae bacterium]